MSTVVPKLVYSPTKSQDIPVWEITSHNGHKIYYERLHYRGFLPIGLKDSFKLGNTHVSVCDNVRTPGGHMPLVLRAKDGFLAPSSWYERDPNYDGVLPIEPPRNVMEEASDEESLHDSKDNSRYFNQDPNEIDMWEAHDGYVYDEYLGSS